MGDVGEDYKALKERSKQKKLSNIESSTLMLLEKGYDVDIKNNGVHLIVDWNDKTVDFWPSTGKWIVRGGKISRGVKGLIRELDKQTSQEDK
tara:strand:+ start:445 stop:720 length:276 start_codon:yes stop_codon:yes gene_type:complete